MIDEKALLEKAKQVQCILIAEDYDEILSYQDLERLIADIDGWISVDDRLPETDCSTLICTKGGAVCTARYYVRQKGWNAYAGKNAAFWMPLPEPPLPG